MRKGIKNIIWSIIGQFITMAIGIVIPRLVIVSYSSEINGLLNTAGQIVTYLALLEAGVGAASLQALYKPISQNDRDSIDSILSATDRYYKRTGTIYLLCLTCLSLIYPLIITSSLDYWFVVAIIFVCGVPNVVNYLFQGKLKILINAYGYNYFLTNLNTVTTCIASTVKIALLLCHFNVLYVQSMYCGISLLQMVVISVFIKRKFPWLDLKVKPNLEAINQKNAALIHQICGLITSCTDVTVLSVFCSLEVASIYAIYNMVFNIVTNMVSSVNNGLQYEFGQRFYKGRDAYLRFINTYETYYMALNMALMLVTFLLITPFIKLYTAGADIDYVDVLLPLLFVVIKILESMRNASLNTNSVAGYFKQTQKHAIIESIINLGVSLIAVNIIGIYGVLIGTIVAFLYRNVVAIYYADHVILKRKNTRYVVLCLTDIAVFIMLSLLWNIAEIEILSYYQFFIAAIVVTPISLIIFFAINSLINRKSFKMVVKAIKAKWSDRIKT